jgi:transcriptional repressor NrdR
MLCPYCGSKEDRVLDSRESPDGALIRRRRECKACGRRYTTHEQIERSALYVVKRGGRREPFDREKVLRGLRLACTGRPIGPETLEEIVADVERMLYNRLEREVPALDVGELVMEKLRSLDQVAYVRFASVYRQFEDAQEFRKIADALKRRG